MLRFADGLRLKVKGNEYKRIHALISRVTPLAMWEAMAAGDDMAAIRRDPPEEFWSDYDRIVALLGGAVDGLMARVAAHARTLAGLSDKEVGLQLGTVDEDVRSFVFPYRKFGGDLLGGRARLLVFRSVRPTGNVLPGYVPSYALGRALAEAS